MKKKQIILAAANILLLIFGFCISSCQQESVPPPTSTTFSPYYIRFRINGVLHSYTERVDSALINYVLTNGTYYSSIDCYAAANNQQHNRITLGVYDSLQCTTNVTYTNFSTSAIGEQELQHLAINYWDSTGVGYVSAGQSLFAPYGFISDGRIKITEITPYYVKATFSATLYNTNTSQSLALTDGELYMKRIQ